MINSLVFDQIRTGIFDFRWLLYGVILPHWNDAERFLKGCTQIDCPPVTGTIPQNNCPPHQQNHLEMTFSESTNYLSI